MTIVATPERFEDPHLDRDHPPTKQDLKAKRASILRTLEFELRWAERACLLVLEGSDWQIDMQRETLDRQVEIVTSWMEKLRAVEKEIADYDK